MSETEPLEQIETLVESFWQLQRKLDKELNPAAAEEEPIPPISRNERRSIRQSPLAGPEVDPGQGSRAGGMGELSERVDEQIGERRQSHGAKSKHVALRSPILAPHQAAPRAGVRFRDDLLQMTSPLAAIERKTFADYNSASIIPAPPLKLSVPDVDGVPREITIKPEDIENHFKATNRASSKQSGRRLQLDHFVNLERVDNARKTQYRTMFDILVERVKHPINEIELTDPGSGVQHPIKSSYVTEYLKELHGDLSKGQNGRANVVTNKVMRKKANFDDFVKYLQKFPPTTAEGETADLATRIMTPAYKKPPGSAKYSTVYKNHLRTSFNRMVNALTENNALAEVGRGVEPPPRRSSGLASFRALLRREHKAG